MPFGIVETYIIWPAAGRSCCPRCCRRCYALRGLATRVPRAPLARTLGSDHYARCGRGRHISRDPIRLFRLAEHKGAGTRISRGLESQERARRGKHGIRNLGPASPLKVWLECVNGSVDSELLQSRRCCAPGKQAADKWRPPVPPYRRVPHVAARAGPVLGARSLGAKLRPKSRWAESLGKLPSVRPVADRTLRRAIRDMTHRVLDASSTLLHGTVFHGQGWLSLHGPQRYIAMLATTVRQSGRIPPLDRAGQDCRLRALTAR